MNDQKQIGQEIKRLRESKGMTQEDLAKRLDTVKSTISQYEIGRNNFSVSTLNKIASGLGVKLNIRFEE